MFQRHHLRRRDESRWAVSSSPRGRVHRLSRALVVLFALTPVTAAGRSRSAPYRGCGGCHASEEGSAQLVIEPEGTAQPGVPLTIRVSLSAPGMANGGFYIYPDGVGTLGAPGEGLREEDMGLTHTAPLRAVGGAVTTSFVWTPPAEPGGGDIFVYGLAGDGNGRSSGDGAADARLSLVWGCEGIELYADPDRDGFGDPSRGVSKGCGDRLGWVAAVGDCNSNDNRVFPGAEERCNARDDNCNGEVDEGTNARPMYTDSDGDGFGVPGGSVTGCEEKSGLAFNSGDCNDRSVAAHPQAEEICDGIDNDCDGRIDEFVKRRCGVGWCQREASSCAPDASCHPGEPRREECNAFDDDCDGVIDNGAVCPGGDVCYLANCLAAADAERLGQLPDKGVSELPQRVVIGPPAMTPEAPPGAAPLPSAEPVPELQSPAPAPPSEIPRNPQGQTAAPERPSSVPDGGEPSDGSEEADPPDANRNGSSEAALVRDAGAPGQGEPAEKGGCQVAAAPGSAFSSWLVWALGLVAASVGRYLLRNSGSARTGP